MQCWNLQKLFSVSSLKDEKLITSKPAWQLQHANSILFEYFCQMSHFELYHFKFGVCFRHSVCQLAIFFYCKRQDQGSYLPSANNLLGTGNNLLNNVLRLIRDENERSPLVLHAIKRLLHLDNLHNIYNKTCLELKVNDIISKLNSRECTQ